MKTLDEYLIEVYERRGSDLHICSAYTPMIRENAELIKLESLPISKDSAYEMLTGILDERLFNELKTRRNIDFPYQINIGAERVRFRVNYFYQHYGLNGVFRLISSKVPTLEELNLPNTLERFIDFHQGLVLFTGPASSGKTTTMAAMIEVMNKKYPRHIITIEDPIEYIFESKKSIIHQRQIGVHTDSFQSALRVVLREDPDVIVVGELRDMDSISQAITAAETGHLVFATVHTSSAVKTIDRIISSMPPNRQNQVRMMVSESIQGVISQTLLPRKDRAALIPAIEILVGTRPLRTSVREGKSFQLFSLMQTGKTHGMITMQSSVDELLKNGFISKEVYDNFLIEQELVDWEDDE